MSLLNIVLQPDVARVWVDSRVGVPAGATPAPSAWGEGSKVHTLAALNAVLAGRGAVGFLAMLHYTVASCPEWDFDGLMDRFPALVAQVHRAWRSAVLQLNVGHLYTDGQEVALVGWSPRSRSMQGALFARDAGSEQFEGFELEPAWVSPWFEEWGPYPLLACEPDGWAVATAQIERTRTLDPQVPIGGRVVLATVREGSIALSARSAWQTL